MPVENIHILKTVNDNYILGMFFFENKSLRQIHFDYDLQQTQKRWYLTSRAICSIENENQALDEMFVKDPNYSSLKSSKHLYKLDRISISPGLFHKRIYRPLLVNHFESLLISADSKVKQLREEVYQVKDFLPVDQELALDGVTQLSLLTENLKSICRTIHQGGENLFAYGNEIRNLLILACTEVEAQLKGIYDVNFTKPVEKATTKEYCKLNDAMRLNQYSVKYNLYPWLDSFKPFELWNCSDPTKSIPWYKDYNSVKHDREKEFEKSNLQNLLNAIAASAILLIAQYGEMVQPWKELIGQFFIFDKLPTWNLEEHYLPPFKDEPWRAFVI